MSNKSKKADIISVMAGWIEEEQNQHYKVTAWDDLSEDIPGEKTLLLPKRLFSNFSSCEQGTCFHYHVEWEGSRIVSYVTPTQSEGLYTPRRSPRKRESYSETRE